VPTLLAGYNTLARIIDEHRPENLVFSNNVREDGSHVALADGGGCTRWIQLTHSAWKRQPLTTCDLLVSRFAFSNGSTRGRYIVETSETRIESLNDENQRLLKDANAALVEENAALVEENATLEANCKTHKEDYEALEKDHKGLYELLKDYMKFTLEPKKVLLPEVECS
jgi:hypothetical protein